MILLYSVMPAEAESPALMGVCGRELETLRAGEAAIVAEECDRRPEKSRPTALRYCRIVDQLNRSASALPVRFPTTMASRDDVVRELARRSSHWRRRIDELDGLAEMVLRAVWPGPAAEFRPGQLSGSDYLRHRAASTRDAEQTAGQLERRAGRVCRDFHRLPATRGVRLACLVARTAEPELRQVFDEWRREAAGRDITLGGPWPPFSFVDRQEAVYL